LLALALAGPLVRPASAGDDQLLEAVKRRDATAVRLLIADGANVNERAPDGATPLHWAVHIDDLTVVDLLLQAKASPDVSNDLGVTPLSLACENGSDLTLAALLAAGALPDARGSATPPILTCARSGSLAAVQALVDALANVNAQESEQGQTALMWAAAQNHLDVVRLLLQRGAQVQTRSVVRRVLVNVANPNDVNSAIVGEVSEGGSTALLLAARNGSADAARALLDGGANVDDLAPDGASALVVAAHSDQPAVALLLLERGANPNIIGAGYTALHAAVLRGNLEVATALIAKGANLNSRLRGGTPTTRGTHDYFFAQPLVGATPFWLAARFLEVAIMRVLAAAGANTQLTLPDGTTPLMAAAGVPAQPPLFDRRDRLRLLRNADELLAEEAVKVALKFGGIVASANEMGLTALHGAAQQNYPRVVTLLIELGAPLDAHTKTGETPLAVAGAEARQALTRVGAPL
jgi:ankyrin repeat protein